MTEGLSVSVLFGQQRRIAAATRSLKRYNFIIRRGPSSRMSTGFGAWYEEKKNEEQGEPASASWFSSSMNSMSDSVLPLFNAENLQPISWASMKESMEAQMPKKILGMGYQQRFQVFCALLFLSALFFALAFFVGLPSIGFRPQKFALSFTCGSLTFMGSFGILKGPMEHLKSMCTADRLYFTFIYFGSMFMTLYATFSYGGIRGYAFVMTASGIQLVALLWYLISFLPGGIAGLKYVMAAMAHLLRPVIVVCARMQALCLQHCLACIWRNSGSSSS